MPSPNENVLEPYARYVGSGAMLYINGDGSWSIGTTTTTLKPVSAAGFGAIGDSTFGWSAMAVEGDGQGGWKLYVSNDEDEDLIATVTVSAAGEVSLDSVAVLSGAQMYAAEERLAFDLNESGGFGAGPVLLQGGVLNLYMNELGHYQIGDSVANARTLALGGQPLDDQLLPAGWEIVELVPETAAATNWLVYAQSPEGAIFEARFSAGNGEFTGGAVVDDAALDALEQRLGVDIDGDQDLPAPEGWTALLQSPLIRSAVDQGLGGGAPPRQEGRVGPLAAEPAGTMTHAELVGLFNTVIQSHQAAGNTPITAQEIADLQALAARGKAVFAGNGAGADYLAYVLGKLAEGSDANRFFNGGAAQASELGSLTAGSSVAQLEKLVQKWLLGFDMPSTVTAGDAATGAAKAASPTYSQSTGPLFTNGVTLADVSQGSAGDCYLIAVMAGLAGTQPTVIEAMFVENGVINGFRSWGVRFFDASGRAHWVTVNDMLPVSEPDGSKLAYAGPAGKDLNGEIWVPLLEKAYAQANTLGILPRDERNGQNSMAAIEGGFGDPLAQFMGGKVTAYSEPNANFGANTYLVAKGVDRADPAARAQLETELAAALNAGKLVWIGVTTSVKDAFGNQLLVGGHAHYAIDADPSNPSNRDVKVYNPWGLQAMSDPPGEVPGSYLSPITATLAELIGIAGLDFMVVDGPPGG